MCSYQEDQSKYNLQLITILFPFQMDSPTTSPSSPHPTQSSTAVNQLSSTTGNHVQPSPQQLTSNLTNLSNTTPPNLSQTPSSCDSPRNLSSPSPTPPIVGNSSHLLNNGLMNQQILNQQQQQQQQMLNQQQQQFCLKWNSFGTNLASAFSNLYKSESLADVTLFCEGKRIGDKG